MVTSSWDLSLRGQRSKRSNFKNHRHAWIELKLDSNDPCDTLNTRKIHLTSFVTQGSSYWGQRSNFQNFQKSPTCIWIELKLDSNDPCEFLSMRKIHLILFVTQGSSYRGQSSNYENFQNSPTFLDSYM